MAESSILGALDLSTTLRLYGTILFPLYWDLTKLNELLFSEYFSNFSILLPPTFIYTALQLASLIETPSIPHIQSNSNRTSQK